MCMGILPAAYMHTMSMPSAQGQKRVWDVLELELQMVLSHHTGAGKQISVFCKSSKSFL